MRMEEFQKEVIKAVRALENVAGIIEMDENIKEYFIEAYDYEDGDKALAYVLDYIKEGWIDE
jgi:hypothetical protein